MFFENKICATKENICTTKRKLHFSYIYKDQQAANTVSCPVLSFVEGLQKLLCSLICTSILRGFKTKK